MEFDTKKTLETQKSAYNNNLLLGDGEENEKELSSKASILNIFSKSRVSDIFVSPFVLQTKFINAESNYNVIGYGKKLRYKIYPEPNTCLGSVYVKLKVPGFGAGSTNTLNSGGLPGVIQTVTVRDVNLNNQYDYDRITWDLIEYDLKDINERACLDKFNNRTQNMSAANTVYYYASKKLYLPWGQTVNDNLPMTMLHRELYIDFDLVSTAAKFAVSDDTIALPSDIRLQLEEYIFDDEEYTEILLEHNSMHYCMIPNNLLNKNSTTTLTSMEHSFELDKHNVRSLYLWANTASNQDYAYRTRTAATPIFSKFGIDSFGKKIARYEDSTEPFYLNMIQRNYSIQTDNITAEIVPIDFCLEPMSFTTCTGRLALSVLDDPKLYITTVYPSSGTYVQNLVLFVEAFYFFEDGKMRIERK
ncbi:MAG: hypothetical protein ACTSRG_22920 [Candidatus Helarchaeota archaeon]